MWARRSSARTRFPALPPLHGRGLTVSLVLALILYSNIHFPFMKWGLNSPNLDRLEAGIVQIDLGFPEA